MIRIRRIDTSGPLYEQACALRNAVLLEPIGYDMDRFRREYPGLEDRFEHFVAVFDHPQGDAVVGCAVLLPPGPDEEPRVGKVMQVAVHPQRQGEGIGRRLMVAIEGRAFGELGYMALYCHARNDVIPFYARIGWTVDSDEFEEAGVPHRRMRIIAGCKPDGESLDAAARRAATRDDAV